MLRRIIETINELGHVLHAIEPLLLKLALVGLACIEIYHLVASAL